MARRKKTKKASPRRRRVSGVALNAKNPLVQFGSIAAGYFLGNKINEMVAKATGTLDPKIVAAGEVLAGFLLKSKVKGPIGAIAGGVLIGAGAQNGLKAFGVISGLPVVGNYRINGLPQRRINGPVAPGLSNAVSVISGIDNQSAYTDN